MAEDLKLRVVTTADSKGLKDAADDVEHLKRDTDELGDSMGDAGKASDKLTAALDEQGAAMSRDRQNAAKLNSEIEASTKRIKELQTALVEQGNDKTVRRDLRQERSWLSELEKAAKDLVPDKLPSLSFNPASMGLGRGVMGVMTSEMGPVVAGIGAMLATAIGAAVSGAVVGAVGLGGIVGGVAAAAHDARVKSAWAELTGSMTKESFGSEAFVEPTIDAIKILKNGLADLHLGDVLGKGADAVPKLAEGLVGFAKGVLPGFNAAMDKSDQYADIFANGLTDVGGEIGELIKDFAESEGAMDGLKMAFSVTADAIEIVGSSLKFLSDRYHDLLVVNAASASLLDPMFGWIPGIGDALHDAEYKTVSVSRAQGELKDRVYGTGDAARDAARKLAELGDALSQVFDTNLSVDHATLAWQQDILSLTEAVKENGHSLATTSDQGLRNRQMLLGLVEDAMALREATVKQTGSVDDANRAYQDQIKQLEALGVKLGFSKEQLDKIVGTYTIRVVTEYGATSAAKAKALDYQLGLAGGRAAGGPVFPGNAYPVGEHGPEVFMPNTAGMIIPKSTKQSSSSGASASVTLTILPGGSGAFEAALTEIIRRFVRVEAGGSVQGAYGYGSNN